VKEHSGEVHSFFNLQFTFSTMSEFLDGEASVSGGSQSSDLPEDPSFLEDEDLELTLAVSDAEEEEEEATGTHARVFAEQERERDDELEQAIRHRYGVVGEEEEEKESEDDSGDPGGMDVEVGDSGTPHSLPREPRSQEEIEAQYDHIAAVPFDGGVIEICVRREELPDVHESAIRLWNTLAEQVEHYNPAFAKHLKYDEETRAMRVVPLEERADDIVEDIRTEMNTLFASTRELSNYCKPRLRWRQLHSDADLDAVEVQNAYAGLLGPQRQRLVLMYMTRRELLQYLCMFLVRFGGLYINTSDPHAACYLMSTVFTQRDVIMCGAIRQFWLMRWVMLAQVLCHHRLIDKFNASQNYENPVVVFMTTIRARIEAFHQMATAYARLDCMQGPGFRHEFSNFSTSIAADFSIRIREMSTYQAALEVVKRAAISTRVIRDKDKIRKPKYNDKGEYVFFYEVAGTVKDWVFELSSELPEDQRTILLSTPHLHADVVKYVLQSADDFIPILDTEGDNRLYVAYQDACYYIGRDWDDPKGDRRVEFKDMKPSIICWRYFDQPLDTFEDLRGHWDPEHVEEALFLKIPTPGPDKILRTHYQKNEPHVPKDCRKENPEAIICTYFVFGGGLLRRIGYYKRKGKPVLDTIPTFLGRPGSGKSVMAEGYLSMFEESGIKTFANKTEPLFCLTKLAEGGDVWSFPDLQGDTSMNGGDFLVIAEGGRTEVRKKHCDAFTLHVKMKGLIAGNFPFPWKGDQYVRRLCPFITRYAVPTSERDETLLTKTRQGGGVFLVKCCRAERAFRRYCALNDLTPEKALPDEFGHNREFLMVEQDPFRHFLTCSKSGIGYLKFGKNLRVPLPHIQCAFRKHCQQYSFGRLKWTPALLTSTQEYGITKECMESSYPTLVGNAPDEFETQTYRCIWFLGVDIDYRLAPKDLVQDLSWLAGSGGSNRPMAGEDPDDHTRTDFGFSERGGAQIQVTMDPEALADPRDPFTQFKEAIKDVKTLQGEARELMENRLVELLNAIPQEHPKRSEADTLYHNFAISV
jgi:hypothetical protein